MTRFVELSCLTNGTKFCVSPAAVAWFVPSKDYIDGEDRPTTVLQMHDKNHHIVVREDYGTVLAKMTGND